ncbi:MAG: hypothetical protein P1U46_03015 [Patescibacteria group bacterium]|nr:hypothetical protein [Patescibacteria group bacterium]
MFELELFVTTVFVVEDEFVFVVTLLKIAQLVSKNNRGSTVISHN